MLSYQHAYHAGNMADVHKHAILAWMLAYMTRKDKPLTYMETHAGRALNRPALFVGIASAGVCRATRRHGPAQRDLPKSGRLGNGAFAMPTRPAPGAFAD